MNRQQKRQQKDLERYIGYDEMKIRKQTSRLRQSTETPARARRDGVTAENWENIVDQEALARVRARGRKTSLVELAEGLRAAAGSPEELAEDAAFDSAGIVASASSGRCRVLMEGELVDCLLPKEIAVAQQSRLAVGDRVQASLGVVTGVLPRRTVLARPDPHNPHLQRVVAANIDVVVHVVSLRTPPLRPRLIDRYLIAIQRGGAEPVLCINKADLLTMEELDMELEKLEPYQRIGVPIVLCSSMTGEGIDSLRVLVSGRTAVLVGHSGVGKSSILNALDSRLELATGGLHKRGTGRHTTTSSTMFEFADGTHLIDTPGIREFGLWDLDLETLGQYFPEFDDAAAGCRFNDCTHTHEPACAVKAAVEEGSISSNRYETYLRLAEDISSGVS